MRTHGRGTVRSAARSDPPRVLVVGVALAVGVAAAAGLAGTARFTGPRWVLHLGKGSRRVAREPPPRAPRPSLPTRPPGHSGSTFPVGTVLVWILCGIAAVVVGYLLWRWYARRPARTGVGLAAVNALAPPPPPPAQEPEPDAPVLRSGIEQALRLLDADGEPGDAVLRAWMGLQETAEDSGIVRRPAETPTEFTTRIMSRAFADDRAIKTLLRLYLQVRFGDHAVSAEDVATVRSALQDLARTWDPTGGSSVGRR